MAERQGRVEVIAGPMFAGKTEELLRRVRRAAIAGQRVVVFTHALDTRAGGDRIASHAGLDAPSRAVARAQEIVAAVAAERVRPRRHRRGAVLRAASAGRRP